MTRILGVGSPFGADRLAWEALDHLQGLNLDDCELIKLDRPGSGLLAHFKGVERLILMDAVTLDEHPGRASLLDPAHLDRLACGTSTHGFGVAQALDLAAKLDELPHTLHIVGLHTGDDPSTLPSLDTGALEQLIRTLL